MRTRDLHRGTGAKGDGSVEFLPPYDPSETPSRPGRLVAVTACPGRHETTGTYLADPPGIREARGLDRGADLAAVDLELGEVVADRRDRCVDDALVRRPDDSLDDGGGRVRSRGGRGGLRHAERATEKHQCDGPGRDGRMAESSG
jgi:hypothetical protein